MSVNLRLKEILEIKGLKITEFSEITGLPYRTAQNYLSGDREPNVAGLVKICTHLSVNLNWLLVGQGEPFLLSDSEQQSVLSPEEQQLVDDYRHSNKTGRMAICTVAQAVEKYDFNQTSHFA